MAAAAGIKVSARFNLVLNAGKATPQPPVGSALGQRGLNLMNFCKAFNDETAKIKDTVPIRVRVTAFADRTFTFETKGPSSTYLLLKAAGIEKGADKPGYETVGKLSVKHIYEIAKVKHEVDPGLKHVSLHSVCTQLVASCKSIGIQVYAPERTS
jgi:large subunit ribosomal protein L11